MTYQNFKSDFTSVHRFYVTDNGVKTQVKVPQHVRLTFFTDQRCGCITVERNGTQTSGCTVSKDGMSLTASVPLSRTFLGEGELFCEVAQIESDPTFPQSERTEVTPLRPGITLYAGKTDEGADIETDALLGVIVPGAIRYDAAQTLTETQSDQAVKNLNLRDSENNFFADMSSYKNAIDPNSKWRPRRTLFGTDCRGNLFYSGQDSANIRSNIFGNYCQRNKVDGGFAFNRLGNNCQYNTFERTCTGNFLGNGCSGNKYGAGCNGNTLGNFCQYNTFGSYCDYIIMEDNCCYNSVGDFSRNIHFGSGVKYVQIKSNATEGKCLQNIHILAGISGKSSAEPLVIDFGDQYLNQSRTLIIASKRTDGRASTIDDMVMHYADDIPFESGEGTSSAVQSNLENKSISEGSSAFGGQTTAGTRGYKWTAIDFASKTITLSTPLEGSIGAGAILSIINGSKYDKCSKVSATADKGSVTIKVESLPFTSVVTDSGDDAMTLMVYSNPLAGNVDLGQYAHAEGFNTKALQKYSHAEGKDTVAAGQYSHAEGRNTEAFYAAHSEGRDTHATGERSHAEGQGTYAMGIASHSEGRDTHSKGENSHAEGLRGWANGANSHTEGTDTVADGSHSHAEGLGTKATNQAEHAQGRYNKSNTGTLSSIGIGTSSTDRKNAVEVMENGDVYIFGVGGYDGTEVSQTTKSLQVAFFEKETETPDAQISQARADISRLATQQPAEDDGSALPLLCGQPPILFGAGTPKESVVPSNWRQFDPETGEGYNWTGLPTALGQQYINTEASSGGRYVGVRDGMTALKWLNC